MTRLRRRAPTLLCNILLWGALQCPASPPARTAAPGLFTAASFNLANWGQSDRWSHGKHLENAPKPEAERRAAIAILRRIKPDILAVQEVIRDAHDRFLDDLKTALRDGGLEYPESFAIHGYDERIQIALFSRFPIRERIALNQDRYQFTLHRGTGEDARVERINRRVERGFIRATIDVGSSYRLEVFVAHLKSKRDVPEYDGPDESGQEIIRRHEAEILRRHIESRIRDNPEANILVLGDMNDTMGSSALQILSGRKTDPVRMYPLWLSDYLRDAWTHAYRPEREYSLFDYAIASQGLFNEYSPSHSYVYRESPDSPPELRWDSASDHRPIVASFYAADLSYPERERLEPQKP
ncbi:MAG TPA: endonuclease/exonuclease/phosphatase family protein [Verrucomicrobiae bacterium]|nr:endonuclease/exonuclease/phosphatase family protein [Verrucomicrobiae bacterium]